MAKARERLVRAHAVREGDNIRVDNGWWLVGSRFMRLPVRFPNCRLCKQPMDVEVVSTQKAVFSCKCADGEADYEVIEVLIEEVDPEHRAFEISRGSKKRLVTLFKYRLVKIIRHVS